MTAGLHAGILQSGAAGCGRECLKQLCFDIALQSGLPVME